MLALNPAFLAKNGITSRYAQAENFWKISRPQINRWLLVQRGWQQMTEDGKWIDQNPFYVSSLYFSNLISLKLFS